MSIRNILIAGLVAMTLAGGLVACEQKAASVPVSKVEEHIVRSNDGLIIRYEVMGEGETALLFVHCWICNRSFWDGQFNYFAKEYRVVRLDLVAHGDSEHGRKKYDIAGFGADVVAVANDLNLQRMVLIGHSMGGPVSVEAAKLLGDRVIGVVGVDTFHTGFPYPKDDATIEKFVKPFEEDFGKASEAMVRNMFAKTTNPEVVNTVLKATQTADRKMAVEAMYDIFYWSRQELPGSLEALGHKLRNINGEPLDKNVKPHESVTNIAGTGHFVQLEKPQAFNAVLAKVLQDF